MAGNDADALDAMQEALDRGGPRAPTLRWPRQFSTWAYRVATNACLDELRRRGRRPDPGLPELEVAPRGAAPDLDASVSDRLDLDGALAALPEEYRAPVALRDQPGLDYAEIAEVLGILPGTVRSRISRGRAALARGFRGNPGAAGDRRRGRLVNFTRPTAEPDVT